MCRTLKSTGLYQQKVERCEGMDKYKIMVKGIVQNMDKYLVVERWYDDNILNPYQWEFVDGAVKFGESPDEAVIRTIMEQTGIVTDIDHILYTWTYMVGTVCHVGIAYLCLTGAEADSVTLTDELRDFKWITQDEFADYIDNKRVLDDLSDVEL